MEFVDTKILTVAQTIAENGGRLYLVGGCVRDLLLNQKPHDEDYCVTGLTPETFLTLFPNSRIQGKSFPVFIVNGHEFAFARKERKTGKTHTDFICDTSPSLSIEEDLERRDLTINSMAIDVLTQQLIDPFHGQKDLNRKLLRKTSNAFIEDPLRVYRVARFAAQLGFSIEEETLKAMKNMKEQLTFLPAERVFQEFQKALQSKHPNLFFHSLRACNCLQVHFPEVNNLIGVEQPIAYHPEGDVYQHTMQVLEKVSQATTNELTRFGAFVHDFGKAATPREEWPHHYQHPKLGIPLIQQFCYRLKMPLSFWKAGRVACQEHMLAGIYPTLKPGTKVDFIERVYKSKYLSLEGLELIANCDTNKNPRIHFARIGNQIMSNVSFEESDKQKISSNKDVAKIKSLLREKRIRALQKLEKEEVEF